MFLGTDPSHDLTRTDVLRAAADPADGFRLKMKNVVWMKNASSRVWSQNDSDAVVEVLLNDGLMKNADYAMTLEGPASDSDDMVTVDWDEGSADSVDVRRSGNVVNGHVKAKFLLKVDFVPRALLHPQEVIWIQDLAGRRAKPDSDAPGALHGTYCRYANGNISVSADKKGRADRWRCGQIVMSGDVLSRRSQTSLPSASHVLDSIELSGIKVTAKGTSFQWEPVSDTITVSWKSRSKDIIKNLGIPDLGSTSVVVIYAGSHVGDLVPACKICSPGMEYAPLPGAMPMGYSTWVKPSMESMTLVGSAEATDSYGCSYHCDDFSEGDATCDSFVYRPDEGACEMYSWTPKAREDVVWEGGGSEVVYHRGSVRASQGDEGSIGDAAQRAADGDRLSAFELLEDGES